MTLYKNTTLTRLLLDRKPKVKARLHYSCEPAGTLSGGVSIDLVDVSEGDESLPGIKAAIASGKLVACSGSTTAQVKAAVAPVASQAVPSVEEAVAPVEAESVEAPADGDKAQRRNRRNG